MVQINFAQKQVNAKIVYYGPGMSGKTTNLEVIHQRAPEPNRGDLTSISTDGDRTLFFDFMPLDLGTVAGMRTCFQVYTVPGQVYYNSTRKLVLQGVDGVIFVADSSPDMMEENLESLRNLQENLSEYGRSSEEIPLVIQYNKRDIPGALPIEVLEEKLNQRGAPAFEAIANTGQGVFPTLKALAAAVLDSLHKSSGSSVPASAPAAQPVAAPQAATAQPSAPAPAAAPAPQRQTISMSQTGFHKAPSLPLQGAAAPSEAQAPDKGARPPQNAATTPGPQALGGLQLKGGSEGDGGGLRMAQPATPPAPEQPPTQPSLSMAVPPQPPAAAPAPTQAPPATATATAKPQTPPANRPATPGSMMRPDGGSPPPRRAPASKSFPSKVQEAHATPKGGKPKSAALTVLIVVASIGLGAALGSFVLQIL